MLIWILLVARLLIEVYDADGPYAFLDYVETPQGWMMGFEGSPPDEYSPFPGWLNPVKASAWIDIETGSLTVYSQYTYTADYYRADYLISDAGRLQLLDSGFHDYYLERLNTIGAALKTGDNLGAMGEGWGVMYPHQNPYSGRMCLFIGIAALSEARIRLDEGQSPEKALLLIEEAYEIAYNLTGEPLHIVVRSLIPKGAVIGMDRHTVFLADLADLMEEANGDAGTVAEIREAAGAGSP